MEITTFYEPSEELVPIYPNQLITVNFPFDPYFSADESRDGRYALLTGAYYGTEEGANQLDSIDISITFSAELRTVRKAKPGERLVNPDMVNAEQSTSGVVITKTLSESEKVGFVNLYNSFDLSNPVAGEQHSENYFSAKVIEGDKLIYLFVYEDGTVEINGSQRYDAGSVGKEMYDLLSGLW